MDGTSPWRRLGLIVPAALLLVVPCATALAEGGRFFLRPRCPDNSCVKPEMLPKPEPKDLTKPPEVPVPEPTPAPFTTAALGDGSFSTPQMIGDFGGIRSLRSIVVPVSVQPVDTSGIPIGPPVAGTQRVTVYDPAVARIGSGFKIADNESPKPLDRVFGVYNYYNGLTGTGGFTAGSRPPIGTAGNIVPDTAVAGRRTNLHRQLMGFEKTFLQGNASIGLRVPYYQDEYKLTAFSQSIGDMTAILKFALLNDYTTGNVFSLGLAVTAPTGPGIDTVDGTIRDTLIQPYIGYIWNYGNLYVQGFHSFVIPTDDRDVALVFNDVGMGYYLYRNPDRNGLIAFIVPTGEVHVTTPIESTETRFIQVPDIVAMTAGVHVGLFGGRPLLTFGAVAPITGPRPFDVEAFVQFNYRF